MIVNNVVTRGVILNIPAHISFGQYVIDKLRLNCKSDKECLVDYGSGNTMTYKQLLQDIVRVATGLKKLGLQRGDVIAICSENRNEYMATVLGAVCCGSTVSTISTLYTNDEMKHALSISTPTMIVCSKATIEKNIEILKSTPFLKTIIQLNGTPIENEIIPYSRLLVDADIWEFEPADVEGSTDTLFIMYSSGTTGLAKAVMLTHLNVLYATATFHHGEIYESFWRVLISIPWSHAYGLIVTIYFLTANKLLIYLPRYDSEQYLSAIQEYKTDVLLTVPPIAVFLSKSPIVTNYDLSSVKRFFCAAAPLSTETINGILKRLPNCKGVFQGYGMTELTLGVIKNFEDLESVCKPGTCGYPVPGIKIKVVDTETREKLSANMKGEICVKGPQIMKGYAGNEAATRDIMDDEGYIKTGDIGYYDSDGSFYIIDRLKEIIKYKGNQVAPAAIENIILQHSGVADCGVVGTPDDAAGELPTAFVVPKPNIELTEKDILTFTEQRLSPVARLRGGVIFMKEIPKSPSGKILRRVLKQQLAQRSSKV